MADVETGGTCQLTRGKKASGSAKWSPYGRWLAFVTEREADASTELRRDPLVPEMLGLRRVASRSMFPRFLQGFRSAGRNPGCLRRLFGWGLERLPSQPGGYALDLDSTRLWHEDGHPEGVADQVILGRATTERPKDYSSLQELACYYQA